MNQHVTLKSLKTNSVLSTKAIRHAWRKEETFVQFSPFIFLALGLGIGRMMGIV